MGTSDKFCLRWNDFETNISEAFRDIRNECDFFDVTLASEDDKQIQAHKVILSACSPFFRRILKRNPHTNPLLYLKGVRYSDLVCILNFMYHGEVNVAQDELNSFLAVAEELNVKGLTTNNGHPNTSMPNSSDAQSSSNQSRSATGAKGPPAKKRKSSGGEIAIKTEPRVLASEVHLDEEIHGEGEVEEEGLEAEHFESMISDPGDESYDYEGAGGSFDAGDDGGQDDEFEGDLEKKSKTSKRGKRGKRGKENGKIRLRGKGETYIVDRNYTNSEDLFKYENWWKIRNTSITKEGEKSYYYCNQGKNCQAKLYILFKSRTPEEKSVLFRSIKQHSVHVQKNSKGIPTPVKDAIKKLHDEDIRSPKMIAAILDSQSLPVPPKEQLAQYLRGVRFKLRKEKEKQEIKELLNQDYDQ